MDMSQIVLSIISIIGTLSSVLFAYLAFSRNKVNDIRNDVKDSGKKDAEIAVDMASIKIDLKYTRDGINRIDKRLDDIDRSYNKIVERLTRLEEHQSRTDGRLEKLEQKRLKKEDVYS